MYCLSEAPLASPPITSFASQHNCGSCVASQPSLYDLSLQNLVPLQLEPSASSPLLGGLGCPEPAPSFSCCHSSLSLLRAAGWPCSSLCDVAPSAYNALAPFASAVQTARTLSSTGQVALVHQRQIRPDTLEGEKHRTHRCAGEQNDVHR